MPPPSEPTRSADGETVIAAVAFDDPVAQRLVAALDRELLSRYADPAEVVGDVEAAEVSATQGVFVIATVGEVALGCAGLRRIDATTGEIKRMYVRPHARGRRVGARLLTTLEAHARRLGLTRLVLETGDLQPEALTLYGRAGYTRIPCFGRYASLTRSVCMAKDLGPLST